MIIFSAQKPFICFEYDRGVQLVCNHYAIGVYAKITPIKVVEINTYRQKILLDI